MKLIIQIPCFNEAQTLPLVLRELPEQLPGISEIEYQIIDDCSTDGTADIARQLGVHHIVTMRGKNRRWLGRAFKEGIDNALTHGADIVVNTDGDNQYPSQSIAALVAPIVNGTADIVIGDRHPGTVTEFSPLKRKLQWLGNRVLETLTGAPGRDAVSGFRAYSRSALLRLHVFTKYTYTVDTLIQAHKKGIDVVWIPIVPNAKTRESRLITSLAEKVRKSGTTIVRLATVYQPFKVFAALSALFAIPAAVLLLRFGYFYFFVPGEGRGHIQSVIAGGVLLIIAVQIFVLGIIGDLLAVNRMLIEETLTRVRKLELRQPKALGREADLASASDRRKVVGI